MRLMCVSFLPWHVFTQGPADASASILCYLCLHLKVTTVKYGQLYGNLGTSGDISLWFSPNSVFRQTQFALRCSSDHCLNDLYTGL